MKRLFAASVLMSASLLASAAAVAPDSLVCEGPEPFAVIAEEKWTSVGASAQLRTAKLSADFAEAQQKMAAVSQNLATQEEAIRADSISRLAAGSTAARAMAAGDQKVAASEKAKVYQRIQNSCASSGASPISAEILEQRPITGLSKIRIRFNNVPAELWVRSPDVAP